jgi:DNA-directed RNA polymerase specialized sigma24 family protein
MNWDEDRQQEYQTLLLEGHSEATATRLSAAADDRTSRNRCRGPMRNGVRPLIIDPHELWSSPDSNLRSLTLDTRSDAEREAAWQAVDKVRALVTQLPPRQREAITLLFGLDGATPLSYEAAAERMGVTPKTVDDARKQALRNLRRHAGRPSDVDRARLEARQIRARERYRSYAVAA